MASPFLAAERQKIFQIAGIPPTANAANRTLNVNALVLYPFSNVDSWQTNFFSTGNLQPIVNALDGILNSYVDTDTATSVKECFNMWDAVKFSELELTAGPTGSAGPMLFSAKQKRREIRRYVSNLIGFYIPEDGYLHEMEAVLGKSLKEFRQDGGR